LLIADLVLMVLTAYLVVAAVREGISLFRRQVAPVAA
jgi:hypothetical protein